jgi:uncharacterized membrane protein YobD (UPF0266 family)
MNSLFKFGVSSVGQSKLAREEVKRGKCSPLEFVWLVGWLVKNTLTKNFALLTAIPLKLTSLRV